MEWEFAQTADNIHNRFRQRIEPCRRFFASKDFCRVQKVFVKPLKTKKAPLLNCVRNKFVCFDSVTFWGIYLHVVVRVRCIICAFYGFWGRKCKTNHQLLCRRCGCTPRSSLTRGRTSTWSWPSRPGPYLMGCATPSPPATGETRRKPIR